MVATKDFHIDPGDHFSDAPRLRGVLAAALRGRHPGRRLSPGLRRRRRRGGVPKGQYSAAYSGFEGADDDGTPLADWLRQRGVDEVDIVGIATDYCVLATAADAVEAGFATRVLLDLTAGVAPESTAKAVEDMRAAGVEVA